MRGLTFLLNIIYIWLFFGEANWYYLTSFQRTQRELVSVLSVNAMGQR